MKSKSSLNSSGPSLKNGSVNAGLFTTTLSELYRHHHKLGHQQIDEGHLPVKTRVKPNYGGRLYNFASGSKSGSGIKGPINSSTGQPYSMTDLLFCYDTANMDSGGSATPSATPSATTTATATATSTASNCPSDVFSVQAYRFEITRGSQVISTQASGPFSLATR